MDPERWQRLRRLFESVRGLEPEAREALLDEACADDPELRGEVESLLQEEADSKDPIAQAVEDAARGADDATAGPRLATGQRIAHYQIAGKLGEGGMGEVYVAEDKELGRKVALKVLAPRTAGDPQALSRFRREARALASLNHPGIVTIYSVEQDEDTHFLTMELVEGHPLARALPSSGLEIDELLRIAIPLAGALGAAHAKGVTHRDLKPANVMLTEEGKVKVLDFGLAKLRPGVATTTAASATEEITKALRTGPGTIVGTLAYMSPEQIQGADLDHRTDVFSLGVILYEMATGVRPFAGDSSATLMASILKERPPPVTELKRGLPARLAKVIQRCLEKDPAQRFPSGEAVREALEAVEATRRPRVWRLPPAGSASRRRIVTAGLAVFVLVVLGLADFFGRVSERSPAAGAPEIEALAVLPLANLSADPEQEYLVDGMTEALITELSKIGALKVISRTSAMRYKGTDKSLPEIASELDVDAVVEGSVLEADGRVRITAQLVHAESDRHLWAESYERDLRDVLALHGEVARAIAEEVQVTLTPDEQRRLAAARAVDPEASEAYLRGRYFWNQFNMGKATEHFQRALDADPEFAPAHAGLSSVYQILAVWGFEDSHEAHAKAKRMTAEALRLDENLSEAHATAGWIALRYDRDWPAADRSFRRAVQLNPSDAQARGGLSFYLAARGRFEEAVVEMRRALALDPFSVLINTDLCHVLYYARRYSEAAVQCQSTLELDPDFSYAIHLQSLIRHAQGDFDAAARADLAVSAMAGAPQLVLDQLEEALQKAGHRGYWPLKAEKLQQANEQGLFGAYIVARSHLFGGNYGAAVEWLERAFGEGDPSLSFLAVEPLVDPLRTAPRFQELLRQLNLPQAL
jgi:serine/threonine protein kinase/TolB-like protein/Tfp pilus assembly protein PilF